MHNKMTGQVNCANAEQTAEIKITYTPKLDYSISHLDILIKNEARADCCIELFRQVSSSKPVYRLKELHIYS